MNTFQLECFLAVADYLNFAKAAEEVGISQPAITNQIRGLENELHTRLFHRTTRIVELTASGMSFLDDARSIIKISKRAQKRFENAAAQEIIELSIGCVSYSQERLLPDAIRALMVRHPNLHPNIRTIPSIQILDKVETGALDIAFCPMSASHKKEKLVYRELIKAPIICVYSEGSPLAEKTSVCAEDLAEEKLILHHPGSVPPEMAKIQAMLSEKKKASDLYFCESPEAALLLAEAGVGTAILPDIFLPLNHGLKMAVLEGVGVISMGLYYKPYQRNPQLKDFIQIISEQYKNRC